MDAPSTVAQKPSSIRRQFFRRLLDLTGPTHINLRSMAFGMNVHPSLLTRYLKEATSAGIVSARKLVSGTEITVLDREELARSINGEGVIGQVAVRDSHP